MDIHKIEQKWQKAWYKNKVFEAEPDKRKKFFTSLVIAYPSGELHLGHTRTFARSDIIARYMRMRGYNVACSTGFHATGNRAVVMAKHIANKDEKTWNIMSKDYGLSDLQIKQFANNPKKIVEFFSEKGTETLKRGGFGIDWRRRFISIEDHFQKFIEWQFNTLKDKGFVTKGTHPVIFCPSCDSPITQADRDSGEDAIVQDFSIWKYPMNDGLILPAATLRPETIFAITNMFINPDADYVIARVGEEKWVLSKAAAELMMKQRTDVWILDEILPEKLIGKKFSNPVTGEKLMILPGTFVDPANTTGVVASEPSDAPDDHIALVELRNMKSYLARFGIKPDDIANIKYKSLIKVPGYGDFPAVEICNKMGIKSLEDPKLNMAKKDIYKLQYHQGEMKKIAGEFAGLPVPKAIEAVKKKYKGGMDKIYVPSENVTCKCGTECYVKLLQDQWFLKYGDEKWKSQVRQQLKVMPILPEYWRPMFEAALEWTDDKACARKSGLGTTLPWDPEWVIETLSDSTIYMAFYVISKYIKSNKIKPEQMTKGFFDYILLGKGTGRDSKIPTKLLKQIRSDFEYWYPVDWRNSAKDLVSNHLLYYIYNHIAIFPKKFWPETISINGYVNLEGEKMSKSKGRLITFNTAIDQFGADVVRTVSVTTANPEQDSNFRVKDAENMLRWLGRFYEIVTTVAKAQAKQSLAGTRKTSFARSKASSETTILDKWLLSRTMKAIEQTTKGLDVLNTREASQACFYQMMSDFRWYMRRSQTISETAKQAASIWVRLIAPYMPHIAEELWSTLGEKGFVATANWPKYSKANINLPSEHKQAAIQKFMEDIRNIMEIVKTKPKKICVYLVPPDIDTYKPAEDFLSKEFKADVQIFAVNDPKIYDPQKKATKAKMGKPGIFLE